jgi:hypothetical protein
MIEAVCTSETSVENHFTRQYIPEDNSEHHTRRRENKVKRYNKRWFIIGTCYISITELKAASKRVTSTLKMGQTRGNSAVYAHFFHF